MKQHGHLKPEWRDTMRYIKKLSKLRGIFAFLVVMSMMLALFPAGQGTSIISEVSAQSPGSISGYVYDANTQDPISSATVLTSFYSQLIPDINGITQATTDANGHYSLMELPDGDYWVWAMAPAHATTVYQHTYNWYEAQHVTVNTGQDTPGINLSLEAGGTISGTITDADSGAPIAGVSVFAESSPLGSGAGYAVTDETGNYIINNLAYGTFKVQSPFPNWVPPGVNDYKYATEFWQEKTNATEADIVTVAEGVNPIGINFTLEIIGSISGYVYEDDGTTPLEGATVSAFDSTQFPPLFWLPDGEATTDADGYYSILGLPEGDYLVAAVADNYERRYYNNVHNVNQASAVPVVEGADTDGINFSLGPGGTISGTVTDQASSLPAADVSVVVNFQNMQGGLYIAVTDDNGDYILDGLPYADYQVSSPGLATLGGGDDSYIRETQSMITVADGINPTGIDFALEVGGTISGHVYLEGGNPAARAVVMAYIYGPSISGPAPGAAFTDGTGYYVTTGLPAGLYAVQVQATGYINEWYENIYNASNATPVEVTLPGDTGGIDFTLELAGSISGTVLDSITGEPVNDAGNGSIDLSTGWHKLVYRHEERTGGQTSRAAFKAPGDADWRWFSTSELEIRTAPDPGADSGIQLTNKKNNWSNHPEDHAQLLACVDIDSTEEAGWYGSSIVTAVNHSENIHGNDDYFTTYYEGYFYVDTPGTWQFSTDSDDASELAIDDQVVAYWYSGHGSANRWEHKMIIYVERADTREYVAGTPGNTDGSYTVANVPSGSYLVSAFSSGYTREWYNDVYNQNEATPVTVDAPDITTDINFGLERGGTISGHIYESDGITPIANIHVYATDFDTKEWTAGTNTTADGSYVLSGVPDGTYRVRTCASCTGMTFVDEYYDDTYDYNDAAAVNVSAPNDTPDIDFNLEPGGSISGHVYETDGGDPVANAKISAIVYDTILGYWLQLAWTETDGTGYYITSGLPAGEYGVRVQADGFTNEWYNGTYHRNEAAPVTVTVPGNTPDIDFYL